MVLSLTPRTWLGDFDAADRLVARWVDRAREAGCLAYIGFPQALGAEVDLRRGRWGDALARAQEAVRSLEETGQTSQLSFALVTLAQVEAGLGREEDCRAHADRAMEIAAELGLGSIRGLPRLRARPARPGPRAPRGGGRAARAHRGLRRRERAAASRRR